MSRRPSRGHPTTVIRDAITAAGMRPLPPIGQRGVPWDFDVVTIHSRDGAAVTHVDTNVEAGVHELTEQATAALEQLIREVPLRRQADYSTPGLVSLVWPPAAQRWNEAI